MNLKENKNLDKGNKQSYSTLQQLIIFPTFPPAGAGWNEDKPTVIIYDTLTNESRSFLLSEDSREVSSEELENLERLGKLQREWHYCCMYICVYAFCSQVVCCIYELVIFNPVYVKRGRECQEINVSSAERSCEAKLSPALHSCSFYLSFLYLLEDII